MAIPANIWDQLKNLTAYTRTRQYGPGMLKALLSHIGWTEDDLRRLELVK
jgi:uncharacterized protein YjiS (DUF1127 family)